MHVIKDRSPVKATLVNGLLRDLLKNLRIVAQNYTFHSLRAGRCVDLLSYGVSIDIIKKVGRWKSNAVYTYLNKFN